MFNKNLHRFSLFTAGATLVLIAAGGLVTSTGSGLSVPDWPLSYGKFFPPMIGGIRFEHSHRMIAAFVGFCTFGLSIWVWRADKRPFMRTLAAATSIAVVAQAVLGGITVRYFLPTPVSVAHACLGQTFFCLLCLLSLFLSRPWIEAQKTPVDAGRAFFRLACTAAAFAYAQLIAGAVVRHTSGGGLIIHLFLAFFIVIHVLFLNARLFLDSRLAARLGTQMILLDGLVFFQLFLGLGTYVLKFALEKRAVPSSTEVLLATAHQTCGALILASLFVLSFRSYRFFGSTGDKDAPREFVALMKPRVTLAALFTTLAGFLLAAGGRPDGWLLFHTLTGAFFIGGAGNALNQYLERHPDSLMPRTQNRALPSGRLTPRLALLFGWAMGIAGLAELAIFVSAPAAGLGAVIFVSYVFLYTPLKRKTKLNTYIGAVPGALPTVLGWVAGGGGFSVEAAVLFLLIFIWQLPHFYAIAWTYKDDYAAGGFRMLSLTDRDGKETRLQIALFTVLLFAASLLPHRVGMAGKIYLLAAGLAGAALLGMALELFFNRLRHTKRFVTASIVYLFIVLLSLVGDKT